MAKEEVKAPEESVEDAPTEDAPAEESAEEEPAEEAAPEAQAEESTSTVEKTGKTDDRGREIYKAKCADCGSDCEVPFKPDESKPLYCKDCYQKHRPPRRSGGFGGGGGGRGGGFGGGNRGGGRGGYDSAPREMTTVTCSDCGQSTQVPFKPTGDKPVYCRDCYQKHKPKRY